MTGAKIIDFKIVDWYARRAAAAYRDEAFIRAAFPNTLLVEMAPCQVQYFMELDTQNKQQIVSVRGTDNLKNAREDADYVEARNSNLGIYVHKGFEETSAQIYQALKPHLQISCEVIVTGHSLGAAISTLLMMYLFEDGYKIGRSINFGQPKVTNSKGAELFSFLPLLRVVDENDLVPLVPPDDFIDGIFGGYVHFGEEVILLGGEYYVYEPVHLARTESVGAFWKNLGHESVSEHYMKNYEKNIISKLNGAKQVPFSNRENFIER